MPANILCFLACSNILNISEYAFVSSALSKPGFSPIAKLKSAGPIYIPSTPSVDIISSNLSNDSFVSIIANFKISSFA